MKTIHHTSAFARCAEHALSSVLFALLAFQAVGAPSTDFPIPNAVPLAFDKPVVINASSTPLEVADSQLSAVKVGKGEFILAKNGHLKGTVKAAVIQHAKVDYWIYAAVFDQKGALLGTASQKQPVRVAKSSAYVTLLAEIDLDFGISRNFGSATFVAVTIGDRDAKAE